MEPGGEAAGVISIERIARGRKKRKDERLWNESSWMFFLFGIIKCIAI